MNRGMIWTFVTALLVCTMSSALLAQEPPPDGPQGPDQGRAMGPGGRGGPFGGAGPGRGAGRGAGFAQGQQPPPPEMQKYEMLRSYIDVVDRFSKLAADPTAAGVAAVVSATDILRQRGPEGAIAYLTKTMEEVKNPTIQRAIRIQLADLYRQSGQSDKALEQLDALMKAQ